MSHADVAVILNPQLNPLQFLLTICEELGIFVRDEDEWKIMHRHTIEGEEMLKRVGGVLSRVGSIVRSSHEHYDGSGYPDGLAGEEIPIEARIVTCCDAFSARAISQSHWSAGCKGSFRSLAYRTVRRVRSG